MNKNTFEYRVTETRRVYGLCGMSPTEIAKETEKNFWLLVAAATRVVKISRKKIRLPIFHYVRFLEKFKKPRVPSINIKTG